MDDLFLGVDLGTSAVKALVVDAAGRTVASASADASAHEPRPGWQEQDLAEVRRAMGDAVRRAVARVEARRLRALGFSSAMHGMMALDQGGAPLSGMMTWADGRAREQAERIGRELGAEKLHERTGCPATALYYPAKLTWLRENSPEVFNKAARFGSIKDAIVHRLTGRWAVDRSHASSNGLLDVHKLEWDREALAAIGVGLERLPELVEADAVVGGLLPGPARELGLPEGLPVVAGAGDGGLANLGAGAVDPGQAAATIGTSGAIRKILERPGLDPRKKLWLYYLAERRWYAGGAINSGGIVLRWLRDGLLANVRDQALANGADPYDRIIALAETAGPGADGLIMLPYLFGERTPYWDPRARGVFFGLGPRHGQAQIARAALEGVCMAMAQVFELVADLPGGVTELRATGGFARSRTWLQLLADVIGRPLALPQTTEGSALGAAVLAMKAVGVIDSIAAVRHLAPIETTLEPDPKLHAFYRERFQLFKDLYDRLKPDFERLAQLPSYRTEGGSS